MGLGEWGIGDREWWKHSSRTGTDRRAAALSFRSEMGSTHMLFLIHESRFAIPGALATFSLGSARLGRSFCYRGIPQT